MINRKTIRNVSAALAAATLLFATSTADAARVIRGPTGVTTTAKGPSAPNYGYGYGRGWCYWHPYVCYRR